MRYDETEIYKKAMLLVEVTKKVVIDLPRGYSFLGDQIRRATCSIALNYAEGTGKGTVNNRKRFFLSARGSANEVATALEVGMRFGVIAPELQNKGKDLYNQLSAMLSCFR